LKGVTNLLRTLDVHFIGEMNGENSSLLITCNDGATMCRNSFVLQSPAPKDQSRPIIRIIIDTCPISPTKRGMIFNHPSFIQLFTLYQFPLGLNNCRSHTLKWDFNSLLPADASSQSIKLNGRSLLSVNTQLSTEEIADHLQNIKKNSGKPGCNITPYLSLYI
jgi:hypothetical protein